jgi:hypothetical protein
LLPALRVNLFSDNPVHVDVPMPAAPELNECVQVITSFVIMDAGASHSMHITVAFPLEKWKRRGNWGHYL